ncbi:NIF3-like protein 1 isoform X2 [Brevipalpus obovatus]|uniref:NIF3-like protein 1 isoform X2 n=1 Tax=Brevipalpus obovatus TaxID=246614 RepID=UPI003D9EF5C6
MVKDIEFYPTTDSGLCTLAGQLRKMTSPTSDLPSSGAAVENPTLREVVDTLHKLAPLHLAEDWDNVGLLVEPSSSPDPISRIMLTIDLTESVLDEAILNGVQLIISYHPPIFRPLKSLRSSNHWKERIIVKCIENRIAIYSPHTALDAVNGGINDWLLSAFDLSETWPIKQSFSKNFSNSYLVKAESNSPISPESAKSLKDILTDFKIEGETIRMTCSQKNLAKAIEALSISELNCDTKITKLESHPILHSGIGRGGTFQEPIVLADIIEKVKRLVGKDKIRVAYAHKKDDLLKTVAVCAGSGASVLGGQKVDLLITGEMSHHEVLEAVNQNKTSVILCEHTNTERGYLEKLRGDLRTALNSKTIDIFESKSDEDPLRIV